MKFRNCILISSSLLLLALSLSSCTKAPQPKEPSSSLAQEQAQAGAKSGNTTAPTGPVTLPIAYQTPAYVVGKDQTEITSIAEESKLKVGARITSTRGPQPLWDIVKRLASLKGMNVSWASDVDKYVLVDVDINAGDDYYEALDNMLRQVDYFHEMQGNTIVIKYKETKQFQISMPFIKQNYSTGTGGNLFGNTKESNNVDGTINLTSKENEFDVWENIQLNIESIMNIWSFRREAALVEEGTSSAGGGAEGARSYSAETKGEKAANTTSSTEKSSDTKDVAAVQKDVSGGQGYYLIDKPVGLITVTAPRPVLEKIDAYISTLKKSLYQQISIEAKIIEVQLNDASSIGLNWTNVLKDFNINGTVEFGTNGQVFPGAGKFISRVLLDDTRFAVLLNALNEQGDTKILSNPKISVMNGQPALMTVGRNVTYIDSIETDTDTETNLTTFTVNTERILSGIGMSLTATVLSNDEIIMNLVPITSELEEPIVNFPVGDQGGVVGLPIINVREMSTTVKVKDGEMLVIGGLIDDTNQKTSEFAPLLGDIPLVKYLFGHEDKDHKKRELIILLRPRII